MASAGDINGDGFVTTLDFSLLVTNFNQQGEQLSAQTVSLLLPADGATVTGPDINVSWESGGNVDALSTDHVHLRLDLENLLALLPEETSSSVRRDLVATLNAELPEPPARAT